MQFSALDPGKFERSTIGVHFSENIASTRNSVAYWPYRHVAFVLLRRAHRTVYVAPPGGAPASTGL
jgi:hypothetical protein